MRTDEWDIAALDLDAYLRRIDHPCVAPSAAALRSLHEAHVRTIPFENVDVVFGQHPGIALKTVAAKLVGRERGGYCYEHALVFAAALEQLGFTVERRMARVQPHRWQNVRTHMMLVVHVDGEEHLADVGFGSGMLHSMPLRDGEVVSQAGWAHRLTYDGAEWTLAKRDATGGWEPLHAFDAEPQRMADYEAAHRFVSTSPSSPFTGRLVIMRMRDGVIRRLLGMELTTERADGGTTSTEVTAATLDATLRDLDIVLTPSELTRLLRPVRS
jgi:N-hydroxyarylamine O-acetyltransferase